MKKYLLCALYAVTLIVTASCSKHSSTLIDDGTIDADFRARVADVGMPEYFGIFADSASMTHDELLAMKFLYAYMPLPDLVDYPGEYFLENVRTTLSTRKEMAWKVPQREFLHFVLPIRVNNENLDGHRGVFYDELKERIQGMSMDEAILEINHWCHEHATYEPSDGRTHSPLATCSSAIGRCGEESTFTVAALRSVGIPARQVYTPRWAHTDDNHAWVEAWADGKWHFLGACEPEAVLDLGWFNEPASRGMLMNTRTPGRYDGPEEKLLQTPMYTDINVTEIYADVDTLCVTVVDSTGAPIADARVDFCLYNYAEFYPVASKTTSADGRASLVAGKGDMIVWVSHDGSYALRQVSVGKDLDVTVVVDPAENAVRTAVYDIVPPEAKPSDVNVPEVLAKSNLKRKAYEDSLRMAYVATFVDSSRGNTYVIKDFIDGLDESTAEIGKELLTTLTQKDLTDVTLDVLNDAMLVEPKNDSFYIKYVMSPRIENEFLVPFRQRFAKAITKSQQEAFRQNPSLWAKWVVDSIDADESWEPSRVHMSPWSVWRLRRTDAASRDIFFVAGARAMGIPARIEEISSRPQYFHDGAWREMAEHKGETDLTKKGRLKLDFKQSGRIDNPQYYTHFTLSKIEDGRPTLLNYPEDADWRNTFSKPQVLETGEYMLITGHRLADGSVLAKTTVFAIKEDEVANIPLTLRQDSESLKVIGALNSEDIYYDTATSTDKSILSTTGRGFYILCLASALDEPSNHVLRDMAVKKTELKQAGVPIVMLFPSQADMDKCALVDEVRDIATIGIDKDGSISKELADNLQLGSTLPVIVVADTFNRVVFVSQGYTIGLGQTLLDTIAKL